MVTAPPAASSVYWRAILFLILAIIPSNIHALGASRAITAPSIEVPIERPGESGWLAAETGSSPETGPLTTMQFEAEADSYISQSPSEQDSNFGTKTSFEVDGSPESDGLVRFTVQGAVGTVKQATIQLYVRAGSGAGLRISLVDNNWDENTV